MLPDSRFGEGAPAGSGARMTAMSQSRGRGERALHLSRQFTGTMPIQEHQRFDVGALEGYLRNHGFSGPLTIEQFKGGKSNPALDPEIHELRLTADEKAALVAFLKALNGTVRDGM